MMPEGHTVESYRFKSPVLRPKDDSIFVTEKANDRNNQFDIKFFFPDQGESKQKQQDIVIILNGFGDYDERVYSRDQNSICSCFASNHGVASVLLPMPFHLKRFRKSDYKGLAIPKNLLLMILIHKVRFWYGFVQYLDDISHLVYLIKTQSDEFFSKYFNDDTRIHLLGYSMGGLAALSYQLSALKIRSTKCDSLALLASGCNLKTLVPDEFKELDKAQWDGFRKYFIDDEFLQIIKVDKDSLMYRIFRHVVVKGSDDAGLYDMLCKEINNTIVVLGGNDKTNRFQWILPEKQDGDKAGSDVESIPLFHSIIIPYLQHSLLGDTWKNSREYIVELFSTFIRTSNQFI